jgi:hypothetical protein
MATIAELAEKIRPRVDLHFAQKVHPDRRHLHDTAIGVAGVLGMEPNAHNIGHLMGLLAPHTERPTYPKMKYSRGSTHVVHSEAEEKVLGDEWGDEPAGGAP